MERSIVEFFDRLLGAVLGHILQKPGLKVREVASKFSPALQPVHSYELVEILADLECVSLVKILRDIRPSLFGRSGLIRLERPSLLDDVMDLSVEAEVDAILKFGQFIGDKNYSMDFASHCSCHPQ